MNEREKQGTPKKQGTPQKQGTPKSKSITMTRQEWAPWVASCEERLLRAECLEQDSGGWKKPSSFLGGLEESRCALASLERHRVRHTEEFPARPPQGPTFRIVHPHKPRAKGSVRKRTASEARTELDQLFARWGRGEKKASPGRKRPKRAIRVPGRTTDPDDLEKLYTLEKYFAEHEEECRQYVLPRLSRDRPSPSPKGARRSPTSSLLSFRTLASWCQDKTLRLTLHSGKTISLADEFARGKARYSGKNAFEVFARGRKVLFRGKYETTLGQLRFFRHMLERGVLQVLEEFATQVTSAYAQQKTQMEEILHQRLHVGAVH